MSQFKSIRRAEVPGYLHERYGITVAVGTLNKWATTGEGPPFAKFSRWPMYRLDQLDAWSEAILSETANSTTAHDARKMKHRCSHV
jgi:hypothetical protein